MSASKDPPNADVDWFDKQPRDSQIPEVARRLLETYSGIPPDGIVDHVVNVRNDAWKVHPYPCIGQFRFLEPGLDGIEEYEEVVKRLQDGQKLLDMACCFGQTIRQLVADGAPADNIYGCDLQPDFIELGYKLFKDRDKLQTKFLVADVFDTESALNDLKGDLDIVYAGSFFHLWGLEQQKQVSKTVASLLRPQSGSMIVGRQVGAVNAGERAVPTGTMFCHNVDSFKTMWKEIGDDLGVTFTVKASLKVLGHDHFMGDQTRRIWFSVKRQ
ncbi:hypothetical protein CC86DRAFT_308460 [Ophiobolus disseminans]|uniref:Methyltransferase domain-containing protein n=1 Tax=Ophiobolus disseminans TaxID=1469910 RepID=A0A6A6ZEV7_9PLEO|nr:hypothetical protein CC86DRAFT_308460 [Ophiobolus disseminans]